MVDVRRRHAVMTSRIRESPILTAQARARVVILDNAVGNPMTAYPISVSTAYVAQPAAWMASSMEMKPQSIVAVAARHAGPARVATDQKTVKAAFVKTASARPCAVAMA